MRVARQAIQLGDHQLGIVQTAQGQRFRELRPIRLLAALDLGELADASSRRRSRTR
jgi:hypothetical protein